MVLASVAVDFGLGRVHEALILQNCNVSSLSRLFNVFGGLGL